MNDRQELELIEHMEDWQSKFIMIQCESIEKLILGSNIMALTQLESENKDILRKIHTQNKWIESIISIIEALENENLILCNKENKENKVLKEVSNILSGEKQNVG